MNESANSWIGQQIGPYVIQKLIRQGGMANVFYGLDQGLDRPAAIKILFTDLSTNTALVERFKREARSVAKLNHPNIVQIYTTGTTADNHYYIAMEYINGGSLGDQLRQLNEQKRVLRTETAVTLIRQIASALTVAHQAGIIHRDIKPSNILLRSDGSPVLTDLGIAKIQGESALTRVDELVGTPYYMSPEQVNSRPIDARSDIYSLGMIFYEMLAGHPVFTGDTPWQVLTKQVNEAPRPITELRPDIAPQTAVIIHTCLQKDPAQRYQTAEALMAALDTALLAEQSGGAKTAVATKISSAGQTIVEPAGPTPVAGPLLGQYATPPKKRPYWLLGLGLFLLIAIPTAVFLAPSLRQLGQNSPTAVPTNALAAAPTEAPIAAAQDTETPTAVPTNTDPAATDQPTETAVPTVTNTKIPRPTDTSQPTNTSQPTATHTPSATRTPSATPTRSGNPTGSASTGGGLPFNFEAFGVWVRGDEDNGAFTRSTEQTHSGATSGKLTYNFATSDNDYVVFQQNNPIDGRPNALQLWVYGDGSGHFLNAWIQDAEGQTWQVPFGQITHTGWKQLTGYINTDQDWPWGHISGPKNDTVEYPISFRGFVLDDFNNAYTGQGSIYLDDLTTATLDTVPITGQNPVQPTFTPGGTPAATGSPAAAGTIGRILYTSGATLLTTDPAWSAPQEVGTIASNSCSSPASTVTGQTFPLYLGNFCYIGTGTDVCTAPGGQYEVITNAVPEGNSIVVRPVGTQNLIFVYQGIIDRAEGIRWSPSGDSFLFVVGDAVQRGFPNGSFSQVIPTAYNPIFSPDGSLILYLKPIGAGVKDVFVSNADGSNARNVTNAANIDKTCAAWRN